MVHRTTTISRTTSLTTAPPMVFAVVNSPETAHLIDQAEALESYLTQRPTDDPEPPL